MSQLCGTDAESQTDVSKESGKICSFFVIWVNWPFHLCKGSAKTLQWLIFNCQCFTSVCLVITTDSVWPALQFTLRTILKWTPTLSVQKNKKYQLSAKFHISQWKVLHQSFVWDSLKAFQNAFQSDIPSLQKALRVSSTSDPWWRQQPPAAALWWHFVTAF